MKTTNLFTITLLAGVMAGVGCRDKKDPCPPGANADFRIYYETVEGGVKIEYDTLSYGYITFEAKHDADSYEWKVGLDTTLRREKKFTLRFDEAVGNVPVELRVKKSKSGDCSGNEEADTLRKNIFITEWNQIPVLGKYRGFYTSNSSDVFDITLDTDGGIRGLLRCDTEGLGVIQAIMDGNALIITGMQPEPVPNYYFSRCTIFNTAVEGKKELMGQGALNSTTDSITIDFIIGYPIDGMSTNGRTKEYQTFKGKKNRE